MYERFFGLHERPFELVPNPRFLLVSPRQREVFSTLQYCLSTPKGLTILLGEAGTGKTMLVKAALADVNPAKVECMLLSNPALTQSEFYECLAHGFGFSSLGGNTHFQIELRGYLEARHEAGLLTALVVDEAQSLPYELFEELRLLGNSARPGAPLLNIVLSGQPELAEKLNEPGLGQLKQRVALRCDLAALSFAETAGYIAGRLKVAGGKPAEIFSREAIHAVYEASGGIARVINVICDNALMCGLAAQAKPVVQSMVAEVCRDFDLPAIREIPMMGAPVMRPADEHAGFDAAPRPVPLAGRTGTAG